MLFLLNLMSGKYILRTAEDGYLTQKNISFAFLRCIGVNVDEFTVVKGNAGKYIMRRIPKRKYAAVVAARWLFRGLQQATEKPMVCD